MPIVKPALPSFDGPILDPAPFWVTPAGTLGDFDENTVINIQLEATDPAMGILDYTLEAGTLPGGNSPQNPVVYDGLYLLHGDETAGALQTENDVDDTLLTFGTNNGGDMTTRDTDMKFGAGCIDNHNREGYIQLPRVQDMGLTNQDFSIHGWFQMKEDPNLVSTFNFFWIFSDFNHSTSSDNSIQMSISAAKVPTASLTMNNLVTYGVSALQALVIDDWTHLAMVKSGTTLYFFVDGALQGTTAMASDTLNATATKPFQFCGSNHNGSIPWFYPDTRFNGYVDEFVIEYDARWTSNFIPPTLPFVIDDEPDEYYDNVELLMHGEGSDSGVIFTDDGPLTRTPDTVAGSVETDTAQQLFGVSSMYFPNAGSYLEYTDQTMSAFGTDDFTIEYSIFTAGAGNKWPLNFTSDALVSPADYNTGWLLQMNNISSAFFIGLEQHSFPYVLADNTWYQIAVSRTSGVIKIFVNGVTQITAANVSDLSGGTGYTTRVGQATRNGNATQYVGHIDELRITKGVGRYQTDYTPRTEPFPDTGIPGGEPLVTLSSTGLISGNVGPTDNDTDYPITVRVTSDVTLLSTDRNFEITVVDSTLPATQDPHWNEVKLLLHMEGPNASQTFTDSSQSGHIMVPHVDAELSDTEEIAGLSSMRLGPGNWSRLVTPSSTDFSLAESNWTLELWHQFVSPHQDHRRVITDNSFISLEVTRGFVLYSTADGDWRWWIDGVVNESIGLNMPIDTWHHLAIVRDGTSHVLYHNGVAVISKVTTGAQVNTYLTFGTDHIAYPYDGYMDEIRYTKGVSRYLSDFDVPIPPFPETT